MNRKQKILGTTLGLIVSIVGVGLGNGSQQTQDRSSNPPRPQVKSDEGKLKVDDDKTPSAGALGSIFFKSRNSLVFSMNATESVTDNLYLSQVSVLQFARPDSPSGKYIPFTNLSGRITYQRQYARTVFGLDYALGGLIFTQKQTDGLLVHDGGIYVNYRATPRLSFNVASRAYVSPAPGRFFRSDSVLPDPGLGAIPNSTLFLGYGRSISGFSNAGFSYEINRRSTFSTSANYALTRFRQKGAYPMDQFGSAGQYAYRLSERNTVNLGYAFNYYDFGSRQGVTSGLFDAGHNIFRNHFAYIGFGSQLTPSVHFSINAGPNYIIGHPVFFFGGGLGQRPGLRLGVNGTVTFSQSMALDPRTFFSINTGQNISDGAGVGYLTQTQNASASLGRLLTRRLLASVGGGYSRNKLLMNLDTSGRPLTTNGISAQSLLRLNVSQRFQVFGSYIYFRQLSGDFNALVPSNAHGSTFTLGIGYALPIFY